MAFNLLSKPASAYPTVVTLTPADFFIILDVEDTSISTTGRLAKCTLQLLQDYLDIHVSWIKVNAGPVNLEPNLGYIANGLAMVIFTLPLTAVVGDIFRIEGEGAGLFEINQNAGQSVRFGNEITTVGVGGGIVSTDVGDSIEIICIDTDLSFKVRGGSIGNFTII